MFYGKKKNSPADITSPLTSCCAYSSACSMWFRRITEIHEVDLPHHAPRNTNVQFGTTSFGRVQFGPKPLKRSLEEVDGEDGDYSRFKRIRVILAAKRVKAPRIFAEAKLTRTFHTPDRTGANMSRLFKVDVPKNAVKIELEGAGETPLFRGLMEEDTFGCAQYKFGIDDDLVGSEVPLLECWLPSLPSPVNSSTKANHIDKTISRSRVDWRCMLPQTENGDSMNIRPTFLNTWRRNSKDSEPESPRLQPTRALPRPYDLIPSSSHVLGKLLACPEGCQTVGFGCLDDRDRHIQERHR
jgi:hypothetical protein